MNRLFFVGAGPGDPQLLTLQGSRCLESAEVVFLLKPYDETFADFIAGKKVLIPFDYDYEELLEIISDHLISENVAFLIPGDLTFYAPFQGIIDHFGACVQVVPGVGVANAASAALKRTLDLPDVCSRAIVVSPRTLSEDDRASTLQDLAKPGVTLLIYMNIFPLDELVTILRKGYGQDVPIALLHRLTLPGEQIVSATLDTVVAAAGGRNFFCREGDCKSSLTLVVAGESLTAPVDGRWWNCKRETTWKGRQVNCDD